MSDLAASNAQRVPTVPRPAPGTAGQPADERDGTGKSGGTTGLKALARAVLGRDSTRDRDGTRGKNAFSADEFEERAAIVEFDGGIPREWAEGFARLDTANPPGDVPLHRWRLFIDDAGGFLDQWAATAQALGWSAADQW